MIAYLNGELTKKTPTHVYIDIGGIAYYVNISLHTFAAIEHETKFKVYIYQHFTESDQSLYGFSTESEKELFVHLISVSGVGPNTARMVLSYMTPEEVKTAIIHENVALINKVKGIGPKTAKLIILNLKDKMVKSDISEGTEMKLGMPIQPTAREEAISALVSLGFQKPKVVSSVDKVMQDKGGETAVEELIKMVLKQLS